MMQTAAVLQLGRSTTYELVRRYVETGGAEGIPALVFGGQYRVPRARLEELAGRPISWPPASKERAPRGSRPGQGRSDGEVLAADVPQPRPDDVVESVAATDDRLDDGDLESNERGRSTSSIRLVADPTNGAVTSDAEATTGQSPRDSDQQPLPFAG